MVGTESLHGHQYVFLHLSVTHRVIVFIGTECLNKVL